MEYVHLHARTVYVKMYNVPDSFLALLSAAGKAMQHPSAHLSMKKVGKTLQVLGGGRPSADYAAEMGLEMARQAQRKVQKDRP